MKIRCEKHEVLDMVTHLVLMPETPEEYQLLNAIGSGRVDLQLPKLNQNEPELWIGLQMPVSTKDALIDCALMETPTGKAIREQYPDQSKVHHKSWNFWGIFTGKWVDVNKRLPKEGVMVEVLISNGDRGADFIGDSEAGGQCWAAYGNSVVAWWDEDLV